MQKFEEAGLLELLDRVVGHPAQILGLLRTFSQRRQQSVDPLQYLVAVVVTHWTLPSVQELIACTETRTCSYSCRDSAHSQVDNPYGGTKVPEPFPSGREFYNVF